MGKSLQPLNAMAVRPPANTPATNDAPAAAEPMTAEALGWQLRAALPPLRLHSVSLYDDQANVLWLSEGALGPDEHNLVLEAMDALTHDRALPCYENGLEDGRVAIFLPVRAPQGDLVGVAMILADLKSVGDGVLERIVSPQLRTIMQKVAVLLRGNTKGSPGGEAPAPIPVSVAPVLELTPERGPTSGRAGAPSGPTASASASASPAASASATTAATGGVAKGAPAVATVAPAKTVNAAGNARAGAAPSASAIPTLSAGAKPSPTAATASKAPQASAQGHELSPQAIDDILEFEIFPDVAVASAVTSAAAPAQPTPSLEWDSGDGLELVVDDSLAPPVIQPEAARTAAQASAPQRGAPVVAKSGAAPAFGSNGSAEKASFASAPRA